MTDSVKAGVIGYPIHHSKSPIIHNYWLKLYGIDSSYTAMEVSPSALEERIKSLSIDGFSGINVTVPHKVEVIKYLDELSAEAEKAGAVNTIIVRSDGSLYGHNTDGFGFMANIMEHKPDFDIKAALAVVLGTGGASRGVCAALIAAGCPEIRLVCRTKEKADFIASAIGGKIETIAWTDKEKALAKAGLLVNATTLGMNEFEELEIDLTPLPQRAVVSDLVYMPLETSLLKQAKEKGHIVVDGLGMLLHQARPAFQAWFGIMPEITPELRELVI